MSAYTPPVRIPRITPWIRACTDPSPSPVGFGLDRLCLCYRRRIDGHELGALPLNEVEAARGCSVGSPAQVAEQSWPRALVQRGDDGCVVDLSGLGGHVLQDLSDRVRLGGGVIDGVRGAAIGLDVGSREVGAASCGCCLLYTSPSPRDGLLSRMPSSA